MSHSPAKGSVRLSVVGVVLLLLGAVPARAQLAPQERLCDPSFQDCRSDLVTYIKQETVGVDAAFWMMSDDRYASALVGRWQAGVPVRLLVDPRCVSNHPACQASLDKLRAAGIPMRYRSTSGILHWKMMLFAGQGQVEFSGANYVPFELNPAEPYVNYTDEVVYYTDEASVVQSFMTKFDDLWTSATEFKDYANVPAGPLVRRYDTFPIDPALNFPPDQSYRNRAVGLYNKETQQIDVMMFRITDVSHTNAMVAAVNRGVPVRLITDETEYRNVDRLWDSYNVDIMYRAGVQVRLDAHQGIDHAKLVVLYAQNTSIFGSSNWTSPSSSSQREHNYFTTKTWIRDWSVAQYERKWNNSAGFTETKPFVPLPPGRPAYVAPANAAPAQPVTGLVLRWHGGPWAHLYDVYFGTAPNPPLLAQDLALGPSESDLEDQTYALPALQPATTYYWKIVSKTMAQVPNAGQVWSFMTAGTGGGGALPAPWTDADVGAVGAPGSASYADPTFTVAGAGADVWGTADAFHFVYQPLTGDGSIIARVAAVQNTAPWAKAGVMIRGSLSAGSAQGFLLVSSGKGVAFQRRRADGGTSTSTTGSTSTAPRWVKLTRTGNLISVFESADGASWTPIATDTLALPATALIGLAVSSHVTGVTCTAFFDGVSVQTTGEPPPPPPPPPPPLTLPDGWSQVDVGSVTTAGDATFASPNFTLRGQGADIWGTADAFHFAYRSLTGDGEIVARVASLQRADSWTKAGVMIRETLDPNAAHAFALVSAAKGTAFQRRPVRAGQSVGTAGAIVAAPRWVRLTRIGDMFTAYQSTNGTDWTVIGTDVIAMPASVLVGLAVTSHSTTASTAMFDGVAVP